MASKVFTRRWHRGCPGHRGHGWGRAGDVDCWICRWWLLGVSRGLLGPIFSLVPSSSNRPVALWRAHSAPGVILAWVGGWVRAVLPEWSSGFWIFSSLNLSRMAVSSMPKMSVTLSDYCFELLSISRPGSYTSSLYLSRTERSRCCSQQGSGSLMSMGLCTLLPESSPPWWGHRLLIWSRGWRRGAWKLTFQQ